MLDPRHYRLPVKTFRITTHTVGLVFESDTRSANHVSIYLLMGDLSSVRLNMTKAGPTDTEGTYTEDYYPYEMSHSTVHFNDLRAVGGLTVGDVTQLVGSKGRKKYTLAPSGVGCRFWVSTIIDDLHSAGYIDPSSPTSASKAKEDLEYNYTREQDREYEAIVPGKFK